MILLMIKNSYEKYVVQQSTAFLFLFWLHTLYSDCCRAAAKHRTLMIHILLNLVGKSSSSNNYNRASEARRTGNTPTLSTLDAEGKTLPQPSTKRCMAENRACV